MAMYTEWHFPYWGRGKGSHIGVVVRAWVLPRMRSGFQSSLGTSIHYIHKKNKKQDTITVSGEGNLSNKPYHLYKRYLYLYNRYFLIFYI